MVSATVDDACLNETVLIISWSFPNLEYSIIFYIRMGTDILNINCENIYYVMSHDQVLKWLAEVCTAPMLNE